MNKQGLKLAPFMGIGCPGLVLRRELGLVGLAWRRSDRSRQRRTRSLPLRWVARSMHEEIPDGTEYRRRQD